MFQAVLLSADANHNYVEAEDRLYITTCWQNTGSQPLDGDAQICIDLVFKGNHRREENQQNTYRFCWKPFPELCDWEEKQVVFTTGFWNVPPIWGATFFVRVSLMKENGEAIPFVGAEGKMVYAQKVFDIDIGWGWGRKRLVEQRRPLHFDCSLPKLGENRQLFDGIEVGDYRFNRSYPAILGCAEQRFVNYAPVIKERRIQTNEIFVKRGLNGVVWHPEQSEEQSLKYHFQTEFSSGAIIFSDCQGVMKIETSDIVSENGTELLSIILPGIAQSDAEDAILTNFFSGGREIRLSQALPQSVEFVYDTCSALSVGSKELMFCVDTDDMDVILRESVVMDEGKVAAKRGVIGAEIRVHIPADKPGMRSIPVRLQPKDTCDQKRKLEICRFYFAGQTSGKSYEKV